MAKIIAGVASSHVPAIGAAIDLGKTKEPYWKRVFSEARALGVLQPLAIRRHRTRTITRALVVRAEKPANATRSTRIGRRASTRGTRRQA